VYRYGWYALLSTHVQVKLLLQVVSIELLDESMGEVKQTTRGCSMMVESGLVVLTVIGRSTPVSALLRVDSLGAL
jgi:hypothetical protein